MHYVVCQSKWWNIHYPKLEGEKTESCNKIILSHIKKLMGEIDLKQEVAITLNYDVKTRTDKSSCSKLLSLSKYKNRDTCSRFLSICSADCILYALPRGNRNLLRIFCGGVCFFARIFPVLPCKSLHDKPSVMVYTILSIIII